MQADAFIHFFWLFPDDDGSDDGDGNTNNTSRAEASSSAPAPDSSLSFACSLIDFCDDDGRAWSFHVSLASAVSCASPVHDVLGHGACCKLVGIVVVVFITSVLSPPWAISGYM